MACRPPPQRLDKMRMRIAQRHHGDSAAEIEISLSIGGKEPSALARSKATSARA